MACHNNPSKQDTLQYGVLPRLTVSKRPAHKGFTILLRIEVSLPKLKFGNNFDELCEADFPFLCNRLAQQLERMGIAVKPNTLAEANVSAIHYSKNLPLTDYTRCSMVIQEIAKGCVSRHLDSLKTDYRNDGSAIRHHASSYEVIVYDKIKDLERGKKSDKRAIETDNHIQLSLFEEPFLKQLEVLRLEVRLGNRQKITSLLDKLGEHVELTFRQLYSELLAKKVLLHYWHCMTADSSLLAASSFASGELFDAIAKEQPKAKPGQLLQQIGALAIINAEGMEGLRMRIEQCGSSRGWYRQKTKLNELSVSTHMKYNSLRVAETHLQQFEPMRLSEYKANNERVI
jgi:hypothetical protein